MSVQPAYIELYSGWATAQNGGFLYGRVHRGEPQALPMPGEGLTKKLERTFKDLDLRALANAGVRLSGFPGAGDVTADGNGFLKVSLPDGLPATTLSVTANLDMPDYEAPSAVTRLPVTGATEPLVGVISDIDDTLTDTGVTHTEELLKHTLFNDTYDVKFFPDAPQTIAAIAGIGGELLPTLPVFYLSGSPWGLYQRISDAFDRCGLPHGAMILRRYSQESLNPFDFKLPHLLEIVDANPGRRWILFGDTGEKDPEVYNTLIEKRPGSVDRVFIHKVTREDPQDKRFEGFFVFVDWAEVGEALRTRPVR